MVEPAVGVIILAAGASTRMGAPKQLLPYQASNLLCHTVEVALATYQPIVVVLGAYAERMQIEVSHFPVQVVENSQWSEGMGSSIRVGIQALSPWLEELEAVVIVLCDQPFVSAQIINQLVETYQITGQAIVASEYAGTLGVPALFSCSLFSELMCLSGNHGAKQLIKKYCEQVSSVTFPQGAIDIDTPKDYEQLLIMVTKPRD